MSETTGLAVAMRCLRALGLACVLFGSAQSATALDNVSVTLQGGPSDEEAGNALTEQLRAASLLVSLEESPDLTTRDVIAAARSDYTTLVEALFASGYYSTVVRIRLDGVEASRISPLAVPEAIDVIEITVDPGPVFRFGQTRLQPLPEGAMLPEGFAPGEPALASLVRDAAQAALRSWQDAGHPKAEVAAQDITARHRTAQLDVDIAIAPGPKLRFGDTDVTGTSTVRDARVRQIAGLPKGEVYRPEAVQDAANRLRRSGTFRSVRVIEGPALPDGTLDMTIEVVDRERRRIGGGAEISSTEGLTLSGFWLHRNLLGGAETLRLEGEIAQIAGVDSAADATFTGRFERGAVYGPDTVFFSELELGYLDEPDYLLFGGALTTGFSREIDKTKTVELGLSLGYAEVTDRFLEGDPTRELFLVSLPGAAIIDTRDEELDATQGYYLRFDAEPFVETLQGEAGAKLDLDARTYLSLGESGSFVFASRALVGSLIGPDAQNAPPDFLYYSGGGGTVRGQPYQSLDIDYGSETLGGRSFAGLSAEMRFGFGGNLGGVLFADGGLLSGESDWSDTTSHAGAGIGVRYKTPVGPLRFDVAGPISGDTGDGVQVYIGIGQAF